MCLNLQNTERGDVVVVVIVVVMVIDVLVLGTSASRAVLQGVTKSLPAVVVERRGAVVEVDRFLPVLANHAPVHELVVALLVAVKDSILGNGIVRNRKRMGRAGS